MKETFDIVIIGGGPGGYNCAIRAGQLGMKVACIDKRTTLGGTCLNVGCIPSKALLHSSELYAAACSEFAPMGIETDTVRVNLATMMARKDDAVKGLTGGVAFLLKKNGVEHIVGTGRIDGPGRVEVTSPSGKKRPVTARHIVIATGSEPACLPGISIDEKRIVSSTGALALKRIPKRMILIGAGAIGLEMGCVWSRLGSDVTIVEYLDHILPGSDKDVSRETLKIFKKQGLDFKLSTTVTGVEETASELKLTVEPAAGGPQKTLATDILVVAVGRRPYTDGLGLERIGAKTGARGTIMTSNHFRVAEGIWAIGDCIDGPMLAHKAEDDGVAVAEQIAGKAGHVDYGLVPGIVYTKPEIAMIGQTTQQLEATNTRYRTGKFPFTANARARTNHETDGFVKILADADSDQILGAHIIGSGAGEMIAQIAIAMAFGAASEDVARVCHGHPTLSEAVRQAAMDVTGWKMQM